MYVISKLAISFATRFIGSTRFIGFAFPPKKVAVLADIVDNAGGPHTGNEMLQFTIWSTSMKDRALNLCAAFQSPWSFGDGEIPGQIGQLLSHRSTAGPLVPKEAPIRFKTHPWFEAIRCYLNGTVGRDGR